MTQRAEVRFLPNEEIFDVAAIERFVAELPLSLREREVALQFTLVPSDRRLAQQLRVSEQTVRNQIGSILNKLALETRAELILFILSRGAHPKKISL